MTVLIFGVFALGILTLLKTIASDELAQSLRGTSHEVSKNLSMRHMAYITLLMTLAYLFKKGAFESIGESKILLAVLLVTFFYGLYKLWYRRNDKLVTSRNFYKVFKYVFTQMEAGATSFEVYKTLYKVVDHAKMQSELFHFSVLLTNPIKVDRAFEYLEETYGHGEGKIFIDILRNIDHNPLTHQSLVNVDQMLFQKYLSTLRSETKSIEKNYVLLIAFYTILTILFLILPLLSTMVESSQKIFS